jgi:glycosyltransferase involved in cell wall biosynthesis
MMPEYRPHWVIDKIRAKAGVLYPGCQFPTEKEEGLFSDTFPPLIVWNHRWEFDKNAGCFFNALDALIQQEIDFRLALLGENFQSIPQEFIDARDRFKKHIVQYGYVRDKNEYFYWLREAAVVISTSVQENFGISIIEAIRYGCLPMLPKRLVYPEIIPEPFHKELLYENQEELIEKLIRVLVNYSKFRDTVESLSDCVGRYAWGNVINCYDQELERLATMSTQNRGL